MKPATAATEPTIKTTTLREVINQQDDKPVDLFEYLAKISQPDWQKHIVYIYRTTPPPRLQILRCTEALLTMPSGRRVLIADEQEMENAITQEFGGGVFRLLVKRGPQIVAAGDIEIGAQPRAIRLPDNGGVQPGGSGPVVTPMGTLGVDSTAAVASRAFDALGNQERTAAEIGFGAMRMGLDAVSRAVEMQRNGGGTNQPDPFMQQIMMALAARLTADPLQQMVQFITILKELNALSGSGGANNPLVTQILDTAVKRFMNPPETSPPVSGIGEALRAAPGILAGLAEVQREQRLLAEAATQIPAQVNQPRALPAKPNPQLIPPATTPANGATNMQQLEFAESKVIEILGKYWNISPFQAEQAADDVIAFLEPFDAKIVPTLAGMGETGLVQYFQQRPILKQATANMERLVQFIRAFLKMHADDVAQSSAAPAGEAAKPLTN